MTTIYELGTKIKAIRDEKGLSQTEVVQMLTEKNINMSRETLSKIENGNRSISAIELNALCSVLGIEIGTLFEEEDDLVTLFRRRNLSEKAIDELEKLQDMIKALIYQKKVFYGEVKPAKRKPLWEEN
ncbi:MAG: helix-turn-helix domain-containing protein [Acetivibrionales bacterium]|jgi:transcriptional regulator with XRE-family HTH domain